MSKSRIPVLDLSAEIEELWDQLLAAIQDVLRSGQFIMGPNVRAFEEEVAEYLGVKHAIAVNSGTDALVIALRAAGIGPGDEVITTPFTFFATAEAISRVGATPVFIDIDVNTLNMDARLIEDAITSRTKAIIPVHLFGNPCDMETIMAISKRHNLLVIEDCAQSFGSEFAGKKTGTIGHVGCYSFFPSKNLGAYGDGGLITTDDDSLADEARKLRVHGARKKYYNEAIGYNSRLDEIQAAILRVKLPYIDEYNAGRRRVAQLYDSQLRTLKSVEIPQIQINSVPVYHQYTIRILEGRRDAVRQALAEQGIETMVYYPVPVHQLPVYEPMNVTLPKAEEVASQVISLPIWPQMGAETVNTVVQVIKSTL